MNTTITLLATLAGPALPAVCLYRATHRAAHRARATAIAWLLTPPSVVGPVLAAQHTHGWGVVGWMMQLATAVICVIHLSGVKVKLPWRKRRRRTSKGRRTTERFLQVPLRAMVTWGHDFWGGHRPWLPKQRPQALTEHREQIVQAMAQEAQALGRVDVLDDSMAELYQAYGGRK
jgi:hypothetical protein